MNIFFSDIGEFFNQLQNILWKARKNQAKLVKTRKL